MDRIVERVIFDAPPKPTLVRVAAYGRVSSGKDAMLHSLSAQVVTTPNTYSRIKGGFISGLIWMKL